VQPPVIVVPGIEATGLQDYYVTPPDELWSAVLHKEWERISLHPDDLRYEALEPARVQTGSPFSIAYGDLIDALRHDLTPVNDRPTPVFPFPYDWRQDCRRSADQLRLFVDEVRARTWLLPHYRTETDKRVDLVGHSMGGLIIADYLSRYGNEGRVRRVVTLGTPFQGSVEAIKKLTTGLGTLTGERPRDRERETARTIPALYQLLPTYAHAVSSPDRLSTNLYELETWQPSILQSLAEFIRLRKAVTDPEGLFMNYLAGLHALREDIESLRLANVFQADGGWLPIVGVHAKTQLEATIALWGEGDQRGPWFDFPPEVDEWPASERTGDGTVPFPGACPPFIDREQIVCVTPDDFSFWEFKDRVLADLGGFHAFLPTVNLVQRLTIKFLREEFSGDVWGHPAPGVSLTRWPAWLPGR